MTYALDRCVAAIRNISLATSLRWLCYVEYRSYCVGRQAATEEGLYTSMKTTCRLCIACRYLKSTRSYRHATRAVPRRWRQRLALSSTNEYMSRLSTQVNGEMLGEARPRTNAARIRKKCRPGCYVSASVRETYNKYVGWIGESGGHVTDVMDDRPCVKTTKLI